MVLVVRTAIEAHNYPDVCKVTCVIPKAVSFEAGFVDGCLSKLIKPDLPGGLILQVGKLLAPATSCAVVKGAGFLFKN